MTQRNLFSKRGLPGQQNLFPDHCVPDDLVGHSESSTRYDYDLQCWIEDGKVAKCGHQTKMVGCYACHHAGEAVASPQTHEDAPPRFRESECGGAFDGFNVTSDADPGL